MFSYEQKVVYSFIRTRTQEASFEDAATELWIGDSKVPSHVQQAYDSLDADEIEDLKQIFAK